MNALHEIRRFIRWIDGSKSRLQSSTGLPSVLSVIDEVPTARVCGSHSREEE